MVAFFYCKIPGQKYVIYFYRLAFHRFCQLEVAPPIITDENGVTYVIDTMIQVMKSMPDVVVSFFH